MSEQQSLTPLKALLFAFHATNTIIISYLPLYLAERGLTGSKSDLCWRSARLRKLYPNLFGAI